VTFNGSKTIDEIEVYTLQDNYTNPAEPTETMTFSVYNVGGETVAPNNVTGPATAYATTQKQDDNHWVISLPIPKAGTPSAKGGLDPVDAYKMDNNKPGKRTWAILLGHELGHARARMTDPYNTAHSNASALRLENKVKQLRYPGSSKRIIH